MIYKVTNQVAQCKNRMNKRHYTTTDKTNASVILPIINKQNISSPQKCHLQETTNDKTDYKGNQNFPSYTINLHPYIDWGQQ